MQHPGTCVPVKEKLPWTADLILSWSDTGGLRNIAGSESISIMIIARAKCACETASTANVQL